MFRNILHSRRVNKARRRLMALLPPEWVTVPTYAMHLSDPCSATCVNNALDLWNEDIVKFYVDANEVEGVREPTVKTKSTSPHSSSHIIASSSRKTSHPPTNSPQGDVSLSRLLHILVKTLNPDSVFALDNVLRSSVLSGTTDMQSDCVFLREVCICTNHMRVVRVILDKLRPGLLPGSQADENSVSVLPSCSLPDQNLFGTDMESVDLSALTNHSILLFDPLLAVCKAWRWPDLVSGEWIRRLDLCKAAQNGVVNQVCINPHHWSRVIQTEHSSVDGSVCPDNDECRRDEPISSNGLSKCKLLFENDPDLICVGISMESKSIRPCQCPLIAMPSATPSDRMPTHIPTARLMPRLQSVNLPRAKSTALTHSNPLGSHLNHSYYGSCPLGEITHQLLSKPVSAPSGTECRHSSLAFLFPFKDQSLLTYHSSRPNVGSQNCLHTSIASGPTNLSDQDCATDSTVLIDSSLSQCIENWNDSRSTTTTGQASSTSTSGTEEFSARLKPKKPRPLIFCQTHPQTLLAPSTITKPWASLSFWEETKHIGQRWFSLVGPVVRVVYDVGDTEDWDSSRTTSDPMKFGPTEPSFRRRRRRRGICASECKGSNAHFIRLSRLVNRSRCSSSSSKLWDQPPDKSTCVGCSDYPHPAREKQVSATQDRRFSTSSLTAWFPGNSPIKRSSSWRQCYRLGSQGIVFHVTTSGRVWIDNQTLATNLPLFVSSSFFIRNATSPLSDWPVYRVPAGYSILVFDQLAHRNAKLEIPVHFDKHAGCSGRPLPLRDCTQNAPVVHISLGKGWGPTYRRPDLTHCPARLELWINVEHLCKVASCQV